MGVVCVGQSSPHWLHDFPENFHRLADQTDLCNVILPSFNS